MDFDTRVAAVEREIEAMAAALARAPLDARVPTCPDWTAADLAQHVGEFTGLWTHVLCEGSGRAKTPYAERSDGDDPAAWYRALGHHLVTQLRSVQASTPMWTWVPNDQTAGFIARRCANELALHRYDAEAVTGSCTPIAADVALDAVDEIFVMLPAWGEHPDGHRGAGEVLRLEATDTGESRVVTLTPHGPRLDAGSGDADLVLQGSASDLCLALFSRPPLGSVDSVGDERLLDVWRHEFTFG